MTEMSVLAVELVTQQEQNDNGIKINFVRDMNTKNMRKGKYDQWESIKIWCREVWL